MNAIDKMNRIASAVMAFIERVHIEHADDGASDKGIFATFGSANSRNSLALETSKQDILSNLWSLHVGRRAKVPDLYDALTYIIEEFGYLGRPNSIWVIIIIAYGEESFQRHLSSKIQQIGEQVREKLNHQHGNVICINIQSGSEKPMVDVFCQTSKTRLVNIDSIAELESVLMSIASDIDKARPRKGFLGKVSYAPIDYGFVIDFSLISSHRMV